MPGDFYLDYMSGEHCSSCEAGTRLLPLIVPFRMNCFFTNLFCLGVNYLPPDFVIFSLRVSCFWEVVFIVNAALISNSLVDPS